MGTTTAASVRATPEGRPSTQGATSLSATDTNCSAHAAYGRDCDPSLAGTSSTERPENANYTYMDGDVERTLSHSVMARGTDCYDCTAAMLAIARLMRASKGKMPYDIARIMVAEDMCVLRAVTI